jgi:hypothetical protein
VTDRRDAEAAAPRTWRSAKELGFLIHPVMLKDRMVLEAGLRSPPACS